MMKLDFDEATHTYRIDGEVLPSVTTICRFIAYDVKSDRPWMAQQAAERGTRVHAATAAMDWGIDPDIEPDIEGYMVAYGRFLEDFSPRWTGVEVSIGSEALGYAGTIDRYGEIDGVPSVLDIKTGTQTKKAYLAAQLTAYQNLLEADGRGRYPDAYGLFLRNDGTYKLQKVERDNELFLACKKIHESLGGKKK